MHKQTEEQAEAQRALQGDISKILRLLMQRDHASASPCGYLGAGPGGGAPITAVKGDGTCTACGCCCGGGSSLGGQELGAAGPSSPDLLQVMICSANAELA